jgi:hypothetical protein
MAVTNPQREMLRYALSDSRPSVLVDVNGTIRDAYSFKQEWMPKLLGVPAHVPVNRLSYARLDVDLARGWDYWSEHLHELPEFLEAAEVPCAFAELEKLREAGFRLHPITSRSCGEGEVFCEWVEHRGRSSYNDEPFFEKVIATNGQPKHLAAAQLGVEAIIDDTLNKVSQFPGPKCIIDRSASRPEYKHNIAFYPGWRWNCNGSIGRDIISRAYAGKR